MLILSLAKIDIIGTRVGSSGLMFCDDISVNIQLVSFLLVSHMSQLSTGAITKKF